LSKVYLHSPIGGTTNATENLCAADGVTFVCVDPIAVANIGELELVYPAHADGVAPVAG
jgi:hypothetical protein